MSQSLHCNTPSRQYKKHQNNDARAVQFNTTTQQYWTTHTYMKTDNAVNYKGISDFDFIYKYIDAVLYSTTLPIQIHSLHLINTRLQQLITNFDFNQHAVYNDWIQCIMCGAINALTQFIPIGKLLMELELLIQYCNTFLHNIDDSSHCMIKCIDDVLTPSLGSNQINSDNYTIFNILQSTRDSVVYEYVFNNYFVQIFAYIARVCQQQLKVSHIELAASSKLKDVLRHSVQFVSQNRMLMQSHQCELLNDHSAAHQLINTLCLYILNTTQQHTDTLIQAILIIVQLITTFVDSTMSIAETLRDMLLNTHTIGNSKSQIIRWLRECNLFIGLKSHSAAQVAVLHCICTSTSINILSYVDSFSHTLLLKYLPTIAIQYSHHDDQHLRYYSLTCLLSWTNKLKQFLNITSNMQLHALALDILEYVINDIFQYNWDNTNKSIVTSARQMLKQYVAIRNSSATLPHEITQHWNTVVDSTLFELNGDVYNRGLYNKLQCFITSISSARIMQQNKWLVPQLITAHSNRAVCVSANTLLLALIKNSRSELCDDQWHSLFIEYVVLGCQSDNVPLRESVVAMVLKALVTKIDCGSSGQYIKCCMSQSTCTPTQQLRGMLLILKQVKTSVGSIVQLDEQFLSTHNINNSTIRLAAINIHDDIRSDTIELLCCSNSDTELPTFIELNIISYALPHIIKIQSSLSARVRLVDAMQCLIQRIKISCSKYVKSSNLQVIQPHIDFTHSLINKLIQQLYPASTYDRQIVVLELLSMIISTFNANATTHTQHIWSHVSPQLYQQSTMTTLIHALYSQFERVRVSAYNVIKQLPTLDQPTIITINQLCNQAITASYSLKCIKTDSGALLLRLIADKYAGQENITIDIGAAKSEYSKYNASNVDPNTGIIQFVTNLYNLIQQNYQAIQHMSVTARFNSNSSRLHSLISGLRQIIRDNSGNTELLCDSTWQQLCSNIIELCIVIVQSNMTLHERSNAIDALTDDIDTLDIDDSTTIVTDQIITVTTWLIIKACCLCIGSIIECTVRHMNYTSGQLNNIGAMYTDLLTYSKHNGTIYHAQIGYLNVCKSLMSSNEYNTVRQWLDSIMILISDESANTNWLRRSAGISMCLVTVLQAETQSSTARTLLHQSVEHLVQLCNDSIQQSIWTRLVHAMNLLRTIFRDSTLCTDVAPHISTVMILSLSNFNHTSWNVRNSALILYGAVLQHAVHSHIQTNEYTRNIESAQFFNQHPTLYTYIATQLPDIVAQCNDDKSTVHPLLHPLLLLLSHMRPSDTVTLNIRSAYDFLPHVISCAHHPSSYVRIVCSEAIVGCVPLQSLQPTITAIIHQIMNYTNNNHINGALQQIKQLIQYALTQSSNNHKHQLCLHVINQLELLSPYILSDRIVSQNKQSFVQLTVICVEWLQINSIQSDHSSIVHHTYSSLLRVCLTDMHKCGFDCGVSELRCELAVTIIRCLHYFNGSNSQINSTQIISLLLNDSDQLVRAHAAEFLYSICYHNSNDSEIIGMIEPSIICNIANETIRLDQPNINCKLLSSTFNLLSAVDCNGLEDNMMERLFTFACTPHINAELLCSTIVLIASQMYKSSLFQTTYLQQYVDNIIIKLYASNNITHKHVSWIAIDRAHIIDEISMNTTVQQLQYKCVFVCLELLQNESEVIRFDASSTLRRLLLKGKPYTQQYTSLSVASVAVTNVIEHIVNSCQHPHELLHSMFAYYNGLTLNVTDSDDSEINQLYLSERSNYQFEPVQYIECIARGFQMLCTKFNCELRSSKTFRSIKLDVSNQLLFYLNQLSCTSNELYDTKSFLEVYGLALLYNTMSSGDLSREHDNDMIKAAKQVIAESKIHPQVREVIQGISGDIQHISYISQCDSF